MADALAYFLTWTTYATWLHGDARGSVDDDHNHRGDPLISPDPPRHGRTRSRLAETPFVLDAQARRVVEEAIRTVAARRGWTIRALNARSNHVHTVIAAPGLAPERVVGQLKAWATRALRDAGLLEGRTRVWTKRASTRWINDHASLAAAVDYVTNHQ